jgi:hypothetical protein
MKPLRSIATVLGFAAITTAAVVTVFWPKATLADDDDGKAGLVLDGTKVDHVVVEGELVKDPKAKTGWVIEFKAQNKGNEEETAELEADLTRMVQNPMSRAAPMPTAVFKRKEKITVAAGQTVTKRYDVPAGIAVQITASKNAAARLEKAYAAGKNPMPKAITYFDVAFKGPWTDEQLAMPTNRRLALAPKRVSPSGLGADVFRP